MWKLIRLGEALYKLLKAEAKKAKVVQNKSNFRFGEFINFLTFDAK